MGLAGNWREIFKVGAGAAEPRRDIESTAGAAKAPMRTWRRLSVMVFSLTFLVASVAGIQRQMPCIVKDKMAGAAPWRGTRRGRAGPAPSAPRSDRAGRPGPRLVY